MDSGSLEQVEGQTVRRTGWNSDARRCPVHGDRLELCFDETDYSSWSPGHQVPFNHDDNRIRWRCATCVGSWLENYFLAASGDAPSPRPLLLTCPQCSSRRVTHDCVPACCAQHVCVDCGTMLELMVEVTALGTATNPEQPQPRATCVIMSVPNVVDPSQRSGWSRPYRLCPVHNEPLELVVIPFSDESPPTLLAWYCNCCTRSWTEPTFRHLRRQFAPDASPGAVCPHCYSESIENAGMSGNDARCLRCRSTLSLRLHPSGHQRGKGPTP